jgi:hypothetical protein
MDLNEPSIFEIDEREMLNKTMPVFPKIMQETPTGEPQAKTDLRQ